MLALPSELILLICSDISNQDLWSLTQVSSLIRSITILPFLARHHISESDIKSGIITLSSHSFFLILVVAHLHPIQKLAVNWLGETDDAAEMKQVVRTLGAILSSTVTIPDISIRPYPYWNGGHDIYIPDLLGRIPQTATRTLVVIVGGTMDVSYPSKTPPIQWRPIPSIRPLRHSPIKILIVKYFIALLMIFIIGGVNCKIATAWIYQLFLGPLWDTEARLQKDLGRTVRYCFSLRLQTVGKALATVTVIPTDSTPLPRAQTLRPVSGLGDDALSAVVSAIELDSTSIRFEEKANIRYPDLLLFLHHHPNLRALDLRLKSIRASSLITPHGSATSSIVTLSAPALYIPYLVPVAPLLTNISIHFHPTGAYFGPWIYFAEYIRALDSIASFPGTHTLFLSLSFPADARNLPWLRLPEDIASTPESRLHRVTELLLAGNLTGGAGFSAKTLGALPRWVRLFPSLRKVIVVPGTRQSAMPVSKQHKLMEPISNACRGVDDATV